MNRESDDFYTEVQRNLDQIGHSANLTDDERDIVDDYESQQFGAKECADHIARGRT
jgi:hypothetical protein